MRRALLAAMMLALCGTPALAAHWNVDYGKSKLGFQVKWGGAPFIAVFKSWKADIDFDPADLAHSHANITIDIGSEASADSENDGGVKGAEGFGTSQFPTGTFRANSFTHKAGNDYVAQGTLSLKGISRPVTLPFTLTISGSTAHAMGKAAVMRTDFHVGTGEWEKPDPVAHEVTVNIDIVASKG